MKIAGYIKNNKRILFLLYFPFYMLWFTALEKWTDRDWHMLHSSLDDITPFVEYFIIPYYLWFAFVVFFCLYFYFKVDVYETVKMYSALVIGMTLTLVIYTVWPNAIELRPETTSGNGICARLVEGIWKMDTSTNVCPSLHVLNTLVIIVAVFHSKAFKEKKAAYAASVILAVLICLSTVFLKQHSWIDVFAAAIMCALLYLIVYVPKWGRSTEKIS